MSDNVTKVGLVGCGNISDVYLKNAAALAAIEIVACADIILERAAAKAAEFGVPGFGTVDALMEDDGIEIILNLTTPAAHSDIALAALAHGKSVYNEKPLATTRAAGRRILDDAKKSDLHVGCAPDTFLGGAWQTARKLIDDGAIGAPVAATAFMTYHGPESWHPDPAFFYKEGAGPMFDMGPYYLTALINLLGPVARVSGSARVSFPQRTVTSEPKRGQIIEVETPTHVVGILDFAAGPVATILTSFDIWHANLPCLEIYGSRGSMSLPDPNGYGGVIRLRAAKDDAWREITPSFGYTGNERGLGVADMASAARSGRPHRANGELAMHVLDIMHAIHDSSRDGRRASLTTTCTRPAPLPPNLSPNTIDA
ncbi:MAG: Gfo/Idh/MocA family oxidoreductase [Planctomycetota bacterium]